MILPQSSLQQLKNLILMNTRLVGKKEISTLFYRMPVTVASSFAYQKMHIKSDQHVSMMFSYHRSIESIYSMELCVKLQDVGGSSSSLNNVEELRNFGAGEAVPFPEISRAHSPSFNAFVVPSRNAENPHGRPSLTTHAASPEGIADGLADSSDEDEIEDDSVDEAEVIPETQPNSTTAEDISSNYALTSEMELEIGLKFLNKETAMLAVKNYNIRRSVEFKMVESDHTRYVCRCKLFGEQCRWMVRVAKMRASRFWKIQKYQGPHSCLAFATL
ncbi:hypothetical protein Ahy_B03g067136 isoform A [Arachis hypogaea]|uniref:Transposase MuDR plant domain-containing protein n=1 Tax=Arachis hypogaea TaxID=3818 RepID=A0A445A5U0_ARAHY|nr:hypothetical protein Ahy_B03g067136 isoform A [Arachis hypogaea]